MRLLAVADKAEILAPGRFLGVASEIRPSDVMVMAEIAAAQARKVGFGAIGAGAINAVAVLVVHPPHREPSVQRFPGRALIGMNDSTFGDAIADPCHGVSLGRKYLRKSVTAPLAHRHDDLALAGLVLGEPPVNSIGYQVRGRTWPPK
jgi:hypothetical protein